MNRSPALRICLSLPCHGAKNHHCSSFSKNNCVWKSLFNMHVFWNCLFTFPHMWFFHEVSSQSWGSWGDSDPGGPVVLITIHLGSKDKKSHYCTPRLQSADNRLSGTGLSIHFLALASFPALKRCFLMMVLDWRERTERRRNGWKGKRSQGRKLV